MHGKSRVAGLVLLVIVLAACGGPATADVPLARIAAEQDVYDGQVLSTSGTVVPIADVPGRDPYFVLEDADGNRVRLLPDDAARPYEGESVAVTGTFDFRPDAGRQLRVDTITPVR